MDPVLPVAAPSLSSPQPVVPAPDITPLAQARMTSSASQTAATPINQQLAINLAKQDLASPDNQQSPSTGHPEVKAGPVVSPEAAEIEVIPESPEISPELAEHVERVVHGEVQLPGPIDVGVHEGQQITISPSAPQQPNIILPISQSDFAAGATQPPANAWRWLVEWVKRIILKYPGRAVYRPNS